MPIQTLIIEDEFLTARRLKDLLLSLEENLEIVEILDSIESTVDFFKQASNKIDLIFMDIHLADGSCFEIFKQVQVNCPIIFTTAFDQYTLEAFKQYSVDYLLKPIELEDLKKSLENYKRWYVNNYQVLPIEQIAQLIQTPSPTFQKRFLVQAGKKLLPIPVGDIQYFFADSKLIFLMTVSGRKYIINHTLEKLEQLLDPKQFFRVNRKIILGIHSLQEFYPAKYGKLRLKLNPDPSFEVTVPAEKATLFKDWLNQ